MPSVHKSKLRAREKRLQARGETQDPSSAEAIAAEEGGGYSFPRNSPTARSYIAFRGLPGVVQGAGRSPATTTTCSTSVSCRSDEGATLQGEEILSTSQVSATSKRSRRTPLDQKALSLVEFLLHKYSSKETITKEDMLNCVIKKYKNHFQEILRRASEFMGLAYGMDVREVDTTRHCYALISPLQCTSDGRLNGERIKPKNGLLITILCVIFTKGNRATEDDIWEVLNMMGIYAGQKHFIYGEPKKLISDFVQEKYLECEVVPGSDPPCYEFLWGPRAHAETSKMKVLEFVAKMHDTIPSAFPSWYEEALREEGERARLRFEAMARVNAIVSDDSGRYTYV